jgi:hypothetical protein
MEDVPKYNTGFIEGSGTKDLWLGGTIPYEIVLPSGDWRSFLPTAEKQKNPTETMACVTFSDLSCLEIQHKQQTGIEPNWSDRFIAKLSGTTINGNRFDVVADTVRLSGVVKEQDWPYISGWDNFYAPIPQSVIDKASKLDVAYEAITPAETELLYHLKQAPLQISIKLPFPNHAVCLIHIDNGLAYYFDSYSPFVKSIAVNKIARAFKIVLKTKEEQMKLVNDKGTVYLVTGNKDKRKIGIADLQSLGLFGDEPQIPMDTSGIKEYNTIVDAKTITKK